MGEEEMKVWEYIKQSYYADKLCFYMELVASLLALVSAAALAYTADNPNMVILYPGFFLSAFISIFTCIRRNSLCGIVTSFYFFVIDIVGWVIAIKKDFSFF